MMFQLAFATLFLVGSIHCDATKSASNTRAYFVANHPRPSALRALSAGQTQQAASAFQPAAYRPRPAAPSAGQHQHAASGTVGSAVRIDLPVTSFSCGDKPYIPGIYADTEANCEVYHVCTPNFTYSFACGEGSAFDQKLLTCNYAVNFTCADTAKYYASTAGIGVETGIETPAVQKTSFSCANKPHLPGLYADQETNCATYHYCLDAETDFPFNCGAGTAFDQEKLTCTYPHEVQCSQSPNFYSSNQGIGVALNH